MKDKGYYGIGCINMKTEVNYGTLFRTAQILDADFVFLIGRKFKRTPSDTMCSYRHLPVFEYETFEDFKKHLPFGCELVCVELTDNAIILGEFKHPKQAAYLLGAEDTGIPNEILEQSNYIVKLIGNRSMNVAVAGSIVIYDRIKK